MDANLSQIENRYAVCVGIDNFKNLDQIASLKFAEANAKAMDLLLGKMGFEPKNRRLVVGEIASFEAIKATLTTFGAVKPKANDLVIFYYAGYFLDIQIEEDEGTIVLASYDLDLEEIRKNPEYRLQKTLRLGMLREIFEYSKSTNVLFIFDTCLGGDYELSESSLQVTLNFVFANQHPGRVVVSSCLPQEEYNKSEGNLGLFAGHLVSALEGQTDEAKNPEGNLTVGTLYKYLLKIMPHEYRPIQSSPELDKLILA
jgi:hypothetical protein